LLYYLCFYHMYIKHNVKQRCVTWYHLQTLKFIINMN